MTDIEFLIESRIQRAAKYAGGSDTSLKLACIVAAQIVGHYTGATEELARLRNRSVSSVQNWAKAYRLYVECRRGNFKRSRELWKVLPPSHWWQAHDIQANGFDAFYYLDNSEKNKWSGRDMMEEYKRDKEAGAAPLTIKRACLSAYGLAVEFMKPKAFEQLTLRQRRVAVLMWRAFAEVE